MCSLIRTFAVRTQRGRYLTDEREGKKAEKQGCRVAARHLQGDTYLCGVLPAVPALRGGLQPEVPAAASGLEAAHLGALP